MVAVVKSLAIAVDAISRAGDGASSSLAAAGIVSEDIPVIRDQIERAAGTVGRLQAILGSDGDRDEVFVLLHQINNQLTGILSLTLLVKDELAADHPSRTSLDQLDLASRNAAAHVKGLAAALRTS